MDSPLLMQHDDDFQALEPEEYPLQNPIVDHHVYASQPAGEPQHDRSQNFPAPNERKQIIMHEPGAEQWTSLRPICLFGCPPGLEFLMQIDQILVEQQAHLIEVVTGLQTCNQYKVRNSIGEDIFFAIEDTDFCTRQLCGPARPFDIMIFNNNNQEVIHLNRPLRCGVSCFPCSLHELEVTSPPGTIIGYVIQKRISCGSLFEISDALKNTLLLIEGPICTTTLCGDAEFKVLSMDGTNQIGRITKQWSGFIRETFADATTFGLTFPIDLDVKVKAVMLGACFLIDFMFFERFNNNMYQFW